ncbi:hypothetical protein MED01_002366 [Micromonospora sp. MED01]|uniref:hypothetical protein n=1 Tax=Micromonospora alfalfae TaxID=2911212 RepID=UPI001EE7A739|nr:hypothetical protein [Micromonospora alfalfae]MCG5464201.1 hypothetical protein [Micromonospora alfalfae]
MSNRDGSARLRLFKALRRARWRIEMGKSGHWKIWNPRGLLITTTPSSASDTNSLNALRRDLRKAGFQHNGCGQKTTRKIPNQRTQPR